ncbi:nitrate reductase associated protein [soil metagenome]
MASPFFEFEQDFVGSLRCIPMVVRHRLDTCGVKLKLEHWNHLTQAERQALVEWPCDTPAAAQAYGDRLQTLITQRTGSPAKTLEVSPQPPWRNIAAIPAPVQEKCQAHQVPLSVQQWASLSELQRFALIKLSRSSHENLNFVPAVQEFGLVAA